MGALEVAQVLAQACLSHEAVARFIVGGEPRPEAAGKRVGEFFQAILLGVVIAISEANKTK